MGLFLGLWTVYLVGLVVLGPMLMYRVAGLGDNVITNQKVNIG